MKYDVQVIGLGYVGLPLALCAVQTKKVIGIDCNDDRINTIRLKKAVIDDCTVSKFYESSNIELSKDLVRASIHVICVPTPVDEFKKPDLRPIIGAIDSVLKVVEDHDLIIIESTIYPGLCEEVIQPMLSGSDKLIYLAHCPERINPGDKIYGVKNISRVVGGINKQSLTRAATFYRSIIDAEVVELKSIKSAEATKIIENIFRDVNIALVNEMAQAFHRMDIDIIEVLKGASTKPFSFLPHYPGVGVGGHCIAVDPYYMIEKGNAAGFDHEFLRLARKINETMPIYVVNLLQNMLNKMGIAISRARIGVYGLAYKPNIGDDRESPSYHVIKKLNMEKQCSVFAYDPFILNKSTHSTLHEFLTSCDSILICTAHSEIQNIEWKNYKNIKLILDGRNCIDVQRLNDSNVLYQGIGHN